jgi:hypothetical protein
MVDVNEIELRDWFAGQALAGILANADFPKQGSGEPFTQYAAKITDTAYRIAEAMVSQGKRLKKETSAAW